MNFPETDSAPGCGGNSNYDAHYVIANVSSNTVPNLIGKSPTVAQSPMGCELSFDSSSLPNPAPFMDGLKAPLQNARIFLIG
jgi:hypothetical protein